VVNNKRVHRLWRDEGLRVPYRKKKRPLRGIGVVVRAMCPIAPHVVWALDFQFDQTADGKMLKLLNVIDEFTRECLAIDVDRSIGADGVVRCLDRLAAERGAPVYVRFDIVRSMASGSVGELHLGQDPSEPLRLVPRPMASQAQHDREHDEAHHQGVERHRDGQDHAHLLRC